MEDKPPVGRGRGRGRGRKKAPPVEDPKESSAVAGKSFVSAGNNSLISHVQVLVRTAQLWEEEESQDPNLWLDQLLEDEVGPEAGGKLQLMFRLLGLLLKVWECLLLSVHPAPVFLQVPQ